MNFIQMFDAARRVSTPIIAVNTLDAGATITRLTDQVGALPVLCWDCVRGLSGVNQKGQAEATRLLDGMDPLAATNPTETLSRLVKLSAKSVCFFLNAHRFIANEAVSQGIWNLRDLFKQNFRTIVLLSPGLRLPAELQQDVCILDEPLPTDEELKSITRDVYTAAEGIGAPKPKDEDLTKAVDAISGLSPFSAEQVTAMSMTQTGLDFSALWERKRVTIEQTPGLSVHRGGERFEDIGGCDNVKQFLMRVVKGTTAPRAIVVLDEIADALAGTQGDLSGVSQEMHGTLLTCMQDNEYDGAIFVGAPGAGKTNVAKAMGNAAGCPTVIFDFSGMKGSLVGESGANLRNALKVVNAIAQSQVFFIGTCNTMASLSPQLRRRFTMGTFFFDLPVAEAREKIWATYLSKYKLNPKSARPEDEGWTGAEIKQCCRIASRLNTDLKDAASFIVPVCKSGAESLERLRREAQGRFISADYPGLYDHVATASKLESVVLRGIAKQSGGEA